MEEYKQTKEEIYAAMIKHIRDKDVAIHERKQEWIDKYQDREPGSDFYKNYEKVRAHEYNMEMLTCLWPILIPIIIAFIPSFILAIMNIISYGEYKGFLGEFLYLTIEGTLIIFAYTCPYTLPISILICVFLGKRTTNRYNEDVYYSPVTKTFSNTEGLIILSKSVIESGIEINKRKNRKKMFKE